MFDQLTSFITGDPIEMASLREVFGGPSRLTPLHIGTIKGNIGHCESAAGIAGLLRVLAMLMIGKIPPLASFKELNPKIPPLAPDKLSIANFTEDWSAPIRVACVNSYGAAGSNAALLCCEYPPKESARDTWQPQDHTVQPLPIFISAHSKDSLLRYMEKLGTSLRSQRANLSNLAFTLSDRREHHRFRFATIVSDMDALQEELTDLHKKEVLEIPRMKPIVMVFGGQNRQFVGLERFVYDTCPRLRQYIDTCDDLLVRFGFPSIIPAIFQTAPISDVRILQTATFAVQYACARCWIDSGLEVQAVIGHSFGELSALVVSGTWTLADGIKAIATRASLIASKWGAETGTMLAVHAARDTLIDLTCRVQDCEIACFNAELSQVVVGSADSIIQLENILATEAKYAGIRSRRLDVSHGFHSKLTEPLLDELSSFAGRIPIESPKIHIETCTPEEFNKITPNHIVRHIRDPVYFGDAVRRMEDRFGACFWVEAGFNSPIIPMLKKAVRNQSLHKFQAVNFNVPEPKEYTLPRAIMNVWLEGIDVSFWPFLTGTESGLSHVPLPSYAFTRNSAWVENVGHIRGANLETDQKVEESRKPVQLVIGPEIVGNQKVFVINTESKRFKRIVVGHAVRNNPLCPASMYMECAAMAVQLLGVDTSKGTLYFEDLHLEHPLGIDPGRRVTVSLGTVHEPVAGWQFSVQSTRGTQRESGVRTHARGLLGLKSIRPNLQSYGRMISDQVTELQASAGKERLMENRAYQLFSRVVTYSEFLRGIKSVVMSERRALAEVQLPGGQFGTDESTVIGSCDTVSLDVFVQVSGLLLNTSDYCDSGSVFVATSIESVTLSDNSSCFLQNTMWKVYATFALEGDLCATGDVFVLRSDYSLAFTLLGVKFTKLPIIRLERLLEETNPSNGAIARPKADPNADQMPLQPSESVVAESRPVATSGAENEVSLRPDLSPEAGETLKDIISSYTGSPINAIDENMLIADLGLDSLAAVALADDLTTRFEVKVSSTSLLTSSYQDLLSLIGGSKKVYSSHHLSLPVPSGYPLSPRAVASSFSSPASYPTPSTSTPPLSEDIQRVKLEKLIAEACGVNSLERQDGDATLTELGLDSLAAIQLKGDIESAFDVVISGDEISLDSSINHIARLVDGKSHSHLDPRMCQDSPGVPVIGEKSTISSPEIPIDSGFGTSVSQKNHARNAFSALLSAEGDLPPAAQRCGVASSLEEVTQRQNAITVAYILEAFKEMDVDLSVLQTGTDIPPIARLPRYSRAVERYHHILQKHNLIESDGHSYRRTSLRCPRDSASDLIASFKRDFPSYAPEAELMSITGPKLAACLAGRDSAMSLLFGGKQSRSAMENYYSHSPMLAASTELLVDVVSRIVADNEGSTTRIIEIGAGCKYYPMQPKPVHFPTLPNFLFSTLKPTKLYIPESY